MHKLPTRKGTAPGRLRVDRERPKAEPIRRASFAPLGGHRHMVELKSVTPQMGLPDRTLDELCERGLLVWSTFDQTSD